MLSAISAARRAVLAFVLALSPCAATAQVAPLRDDFDSIDGWQALPSDGVKASLAQEDGPHGKCLRLDFDFAAGMGFVVVRREFKTDLPANYELAFDLRGECPPNNLEFKLVAPGGDDVWWVNRREHEFSRDWRRIAYKRRHFVFAWGPSAGKPLERLGAIEFAIAAAMGGKGSVWIDRLTFEPLPEPTPYTGRAIVSTSSAEGDAPAALGADGSLRWTSAPADATPNLVVDFGQVRELGGLRIDWDGRHFARAYEVQYSRDGRQWETVASVADNAEGADFIATPDAAAAQVRIAVSKPSDGGAVGVQSVRVLEVAETQNQNEMLATIARSAPRGLYPRYTLGEQSYWTIVGAAGDAKEALIDADGAIEIGKKRWRIEPFLWVDGKLVTWSGVKSTQSLAQEYLPIPTVKWDAGQTALEITALADGPAGDSRLIARYCVQNRAADARKATLFLALRPLQVLPPWQQLNITGGAARVAKIVRNDQLILVDDECLLPWTKFDGFGATQRLRGEIVEDLARGTLPSAAGVEDAEQLGSAALRYDFEIPAGGSRCAFVTVPFHKLRETDPCGITEAEAVRRFDETLARVSSSWVDALNQVKVALPPSAAQWELSFRSNQAYILINADGPAIQPGSRTYERSWIRDGALTSTALLYTGHTELVRSFLEFYAPNQYPSGKIPCVVDRRGPDPVPENDSHGQFIYLVWTTYQFTRDRAILERHLPRVAKTVEYIESLRAERMTPEYRDGPPEQRAKFGLVPESISHEGYSAKPMHSYWDDFFVLRGLDDAVSIARELGKADLAERWDAARRDFEKCLVESIALAMKNRGIDYLPGCVELGDFDATSTSIGVYPCGLSSRLPADALRTTFDRYWQFAVDRRDGRVPWKDYTPYEIRSVNTLLRLGQPQRAQELMEFFFRGQRPAGWNHWAEVVWREPKWPGFIGDMPHGWVGSEFLRVFRSFFIYERDDADGLVLLGGAKADWLDGDGARLSGWPTRYGKLDLTARIEGDRLIVVLGGDVQLPAGGAILVRNPSDRTVRDAVLDGRPAPLVDGFAKLERADGTLIMNLAP